MASEGQETDRGPVEYAVYEAVVLTEEGALEPAHPGDGPASVLRFVGTVRADSKDDARWAAVDGDSRLSHAVIKEGTAAYLLPIPTRLARPAETVEQIVQKKVRR